MHCACWYDFDPIQGQGQGHGDSEFPKIAKNYCLLALSPPPFWHAAQNWWLIVTVWDLVYSLLDPDFRISFKKAMMWVQTSLNVDITQTSNGHISVLLEATVASSGMLVVLYVLHMLIWPWPDPRSRSLTFWISENCTFLRLFPPPFWHGAQNWWLIMIVWT